MTTYLLDVNLLLALAWPNHEFHRRARHWWKQRPRSWATCAITELGFIRLSSNRAFTADAVSPYEAAALLDQLSQSGEHQYWKELSHFPPIDFRALAGYRQVTDFYLVRLATRHKAKLATFDSGIEAIAAPDELEIIRS